MIRRSLQILVLIAIALTIYTGGDVERFCPIGGMSSLSGQFLHQRMSCTMSAVNLFLFASVLVAVVLAGKLFCSHLCPLGSACEGTSALGRRLGLARDLKGNADRILRAAKWILLWFVLHETYVASELFCKRFEPYFALSSGFHPDITLWAAILAIVVCFLGSLVLRLFWCKYLCFFHAAQTSVATVYAPVAAGAYFVGATMAGTTPSMAAFFGILCVLGYVGELRGLKLLPLVKVKRASEACTDCGLCDRACPMGIAVSKSICCVTDADCHLCGACVAACPPKISALSYRGPWKAWMAPVLVLLLFGGSFFAAERWGSSSRFATVRMVPDGLRVNGTTVAVHARTGVKNIHCWGSSMSFLARMGKRRGPGFDWHAGILGAETYAASKGFRVFYDPRKIQPGEIDHLIFSEGRYAIRPVSSIDPAHVKEVSVIQAGLLAFMDDVDIATLRKKLARSPHVFAMETEWGEPVQTRFYFDGKEVDARAIMAIVADPSPVTVGGSPRSLAIDLRGSPKTLPALDVQTFRSRFFPAFDKWFAEGKLAPPDKTAVLELPLKGLDDPSLAFDLRWLNGYLARQPGLIRMRTRLGSGKLPLLWIHYDDTKTDAAAIEKAATVGTFVLVLGKEKKRVERKNPFTLEGKVRPVPREEVFAADL